MERMFLLMHQIHVRVAFKLRKIQTETDRKRADKISWVWKLYQSLSTCDLNEIMTRSVPFGILLLRLATEKVPKVDVLCLPALAKVNVTEVHKFTHEIDKWAQHTCRAQTIVLEETKSIGREHRPHHSSQSYWLQSSRIIHFSVCLPDIHTFMGTVGLVWNSFKWMTKKTNQCHCISDKMYIYKSLL